MCIRDSPYAIRESKEKFDIHASSHKIEKWNKILSNEGSVSKNTSPMTRDPMKKTQIGTIEPFQSIDTREKTHKGVSWLDSYNSILSSLENRTQGKKPGEAISKFQYNERKATGIENWGNTTRRDEYKVERPEKKSVLTPREEPNFNEIYKSKAASSSHLSTCLGKTLAENSYQSGSPIIERCVRDKIPAQNNFHFQDQGKSSNKINFSSVLQSNANKEPTNPGKVTLIYSDSVSQPSVEETPLQTEAISKEIPVTESSPKTACTSQLFTRKLSFMPESTKKILQKLTNVNVSQNSETNRKKADKESSDQLSAQPSLRRDRSNVINIGKMGESKTDTIECYDGETIDGIPYGRGRRIYPSGEIYIGNWTEGKRDGYGSLLYSDGSVRYEGQWRNDEFNGQGVLITLAKKPAGNVKLINPLKLVVTEDVVQRYEGSFTCGELNGICTLHFVTGEKFSGFFLRGMACGRGTFYSSDQRIIQGEWTDNAMTSIL
eukprot:TRINITY_DN3868_c0_g2_i2.p1 TRINITY_DN3868_c0_g2~~TRINITY_DN3868_c0_g2_i2.p1  ORF type:complete len:491 (-),score=68.30 TRINITY_DN3868_c0_g2_i2:81-1553(-)